MRMAENQSNHRIKIENEVVIGRVKQSGRGQTYGLIIVFFTIGSSVALALLGHETVACVIGGGTVVSLATVFVLGKREQHLKLEGKKPNFGEPPTPTPNLA
jgi:uncharacterized membrane protein